MKRVVLVILLIMVIPVVVNLGLMIGSLFSVVPLVFYAVMSGSVLYLVLVLGVLVAEYFGGKK